MIKVLGKGGHNLIWDGEQAHLLLHRSSRPSLPFRSDEETEAVWNSKISYYGKGHVNQIQAFVDALVTGEAPRYTAENGM